MRWPRNRRLIYGACLAHRAWLSQICLQPEGIDQNLGGMVARIDMAVNSFDASVSSDEIANPIGLPGFAIGAGAVGDSYFALAVG